MHKFPFFAIFRWKPRGLNFGPMNSDYTYSRCVSRARKKDDLSDPEGAAGEGQFGHMQFLA